MGNHLKNIHFTTVVGALTSVHVMYGAHYISDQFTLKNKDNIYLCFICAHFIQTALINVQFFLFSYFSSLYFLHHQDFKSQISITFHLQISTQKFCTRTEDISNETKVSRVYISDLKVHLGIILELFTCPKLMLK